MKAAAYLRVSTLEQDVANQRPSVLELAKRNELELVREYAENVSARGARPQFDKLLRDARAGKFRAVVVWSLDRFGRSMHGNVLALLELDQIGVRVLSVREPWLDSSGPTRSLLIAIFSWVAEQERLQISSRTVAGMERARARGRHVGRPAAYVNQTKLRELAAQGNSVRAIARALGMPRSTVYDALKELNNEDERQ